MIAGKTGPQPSDFAKAATSGELNRRLEGRFLAVEQGRFLGDGVEKEVPRSFTARASRSTTLRERPSTERSGLRNASTRNLSDFSARMRCSLASAAFWSATTRWRDSFRRASASLLQATERIGTASPSRTRRHENRGRHACDNRLMPLEPSSDPGRNQLGAGGYGLVGEPRLDILGERSAES